jgi:L-ascorbate metabolism protein UlaG (beta-lactamase superfamily)
MPFNGIGITLGIIDGIEFAKDINPELIIPVHMEMKQPILNPNLELLKESLEKENLNYKILNVKEKVAI